MRKQTVARAEIDDTAAAKLAPGAPGDFPGFVQLFARQTTGIAHGLAHAIEQRTAAKTACVARREPSLRGV